MTEQKQTLRKQIWTELRDKGEARFPFPVEGRIPNFNGAERAADELTKIQPFQQAEVLKINPDSPQKPVREHALNAGKTILVPTPRLKSGFHKIDGSPLSREEIKKASTLKGMSDYSTHAPLEKLREVDAVVTGSVVVSTEGGRIGKGEGYSDLEYAIMKEVDGSDVPVLTTVHSIQLVEKFETEPHDISLNWIVTPDMTIETNSSPSGPAGIDWSLLTEDDLDDMPVLKTLKKR